MKFMADISSLTRHRGAAALSASHLPFLRQRSRSCSVPCPQTAGREFSLVRLWWRQQGNAGGCEQHSTILLATAGAPCAESPHTYSGNSQAWPLRLGVLNHCNLSQCFKFATLKKNKSISFLLLNFFFILQCALCRSKNYRHVLWGDGLFL